ncbi:RHS repeat-associated core domain-containing protein [Lysinibacillus sphaericus]|uniref:RHS repeat-associated core domain-containing protein n=1 Tax=Lysinibacillus sphaericus TaxID=1421 RepID=UPI001FAFB73D|nr:RHS repeat-associated core domain-containing protein [Lysinibacillus sphaericus]
MNQSGTMATINPYRYAGYRYDEDSKLYYLMARYYNPDRGVFLSLDPVRGDTMNPLSLNGYNYANNNPVMNVDPDGTAAVKYYVTKTTTYALVTALVYLFREFIGGITASAIVGAFVGAVMSYKTTVNARKVTTVGEAMRTAIQNPNYIKQV